MHIMKARAGSVPGYTWKEDGQILEVEDDFAEELLAIPGGGFSIAAAPTPPPVEPADEEDDSDEPEEVAEEPAVTPKTGGRPRLPRDENGKIIRN